MRILFILLTVVIIGLSTSQPGISGLVTAYQGGKVYQGWIDDKGTVVIMNDRGKTIMNGHVNRMGGISIRDDKNDDVYEGRVSGFGKASLTSSKGGSPLRLEFER
jgi:hypothetical protein